MWVSICVILMTSWGTLNLHPNAPTTANYVTLYDYCLFWLYTLLQVLVTICVGSRWCRSTPALTCVNKLFSCVSETVPIPFSHSVVPWWGSPASAATRYGSGRGSPVSKCSPAGQTLWTPHPQPSGSFESCLMFWSRSPPAPPDAVKRPGNEKLGEKGRGNREARSQRIFWGFGLIDPSSVSKSLNWIPFTISHCRHCGAEPEI